MQINDEVPSGLKEVKEQEIVEEVPIEIVCKELVNARNRFIFYETEKGELRLIFDHIGPVLYACMVARFSHPVYNKVYEFFRYVLEGVHQAKKCTIKGFERACKIEKLI